MTSKIVEPITTRELPTIRFPVYKFDEDLREVPDDLETWQDFIEGLKVQLKTETSPDAKKLIYENLGVAARVIGRFTEAETYLQKALALATASGAISSVVQNQIRLAHVYQWMKSYSKATVLFDQARQLINLNKTSESLRAAYHQHKGKVFFDQGLYGIAVCEFEAALKIRKTIRSSADQIESSQNSLAEAKKRWSIKITEGISIRVAQMPDAEAIHAAHMLSIKEICSKDHSFDEIRVWGGRKYKPDFRIPAIQNNHYLVVEKANQIEGFCQFEVEIIDDKKVGSLFGLYITPKVLKMNVGHALIHLVFEYAKNENLDVIKLKSTITSLGFYKKYGFEQTGPLIELPLEGVMLRGYPMKKIL